jgi:hypothetical protein
MFEANSQALKIAVLETALVLSSIASTFAQTENVRLEVGVQAGPSIFIATGGHETIGGFLVVGEPHLEYFLSGEFAVGVTGLFYRNIEGVESRLFFGAAYGDINYFFSSTSPLSAYIGARVGVFKPNSGILFGLGPQTGLKFFATSQFSINVQLDGAIHQASEGTLFLSSLVLGLSYYMK